VFFNPEEASAMPTDPMTGWFHTPIKNGTYRILANAQDYMPGFKDVTVEPGRDTQVKIELLRAKLAEVKKPKVVLEQKAKKINVTEQIFFEFNKTKVLPISFGLLDEIVQIIAENPTLHIVVEGHTDNVGSENFNQKLSQGRAESIVEYFVNKGIAPDRLRAIGYGLSKPMAGNDTPDGRAKNRRVEFTIVNE